MWNVITGMEVNILGFCLQRSSPPVATECVTRVWILFDEGLNVWMLNQFFWTEGKHSELRQVDRIVIHWLLKFYSAIEEHVSILTNVVIQINIEANFPTLNQAWNNTEAMSFVVLVGLGAPFKSVPLTDRWCDGSALCKWWRPCPLKDEIPAKINGHHDSYRDQSALLRANTPTK